MDFKGQYLTYNEYRAMGGTLNQTPFNLLEFEARKKVDERTFGRLKVCNEVPQEVKMCVLAIVNNLQSYMDVVNGNKNVASESTDGYSINYITGTQVHETIKSKNSEIEDIIRTYLTGVAVNGTHILYLGV